MGACDICASYEAFESLPLPRDFGDDSTLLAY